MTQETTNPIAVDLFADFALNETTENQGAWVPYSSNVEFLIARTGNRKYRKSFTHQFKKNQRLLDSGTETADAKAEEILIDVMANTILLGWKGNVTIKGVKLEYSAANAKKLLAIPLFREYISKCADDQAAYKAVQDDQDEKK